MENPSQNKVVGVRFTKIGKVYFFDASKFPEAQPGDNVVVETSRGVQMGSITHIVKDPPNAPESPWKPIERMATPRDLLQRQSWQQKEMEVLTAARKRANELKIDGIKIITTEYSFDGSKLAILFNTESEEKIDLKTLRQDLGRMFNPVQIEIRQIGPRDVAKFLGGMGACGMECRCCSRFLTEFNTISIRMAKEQGISLTPTEITGMCGRLRCCLIYEYQQYVDARAGLPKRNKRVKTPIGEGRVVEVYPLRQGILVEIPEVGFREFRHDEIEPADELEQLQQKLKSPNPVDDLAIDGSINENDQDTSTEAEES